MKRSGYTQILLILGIFFALAVSHLPVVYTLLYHTLTNAPISENGTFHLSGVPDSEHIVLDGEWAFYWNRLLITDRQREAGPDFLIHVPDYWSKYKMNGAYLPADGFASYRLMLKGLYPSYPVTIFLSDFGSAYRVFIDGTLTAESGIVSKNPAEVITTTKASLYPVTLAANQVHEVVIEVATTRFSGLYIAPVMTGYDSAVQSGNARNNLRFLLFGTALSSFIVLMVGYVLSVRTFRRSFWLPIIGLSVLLRIMLTTEFYSFWQNTVFFHLSYEAVNPLAYILSFVFKYLLIFLIQELLGIMFSQKEKLGLLLYYTVLYLLYLIIPHDFYNRYLTILLPACSFLMEVYAFFKIYLNRQQLKKYGLLVYWGAVLAITGLIIDCYYINGNIYFNLSLVLLPLFTGYLMILGLISAIQAADVARDFAVSSAHLASARKQIAMQAEYYEALSEQIGEIRAIGHDVRHFVGVIRRLSEDGCYEELNKFSSEYVAKADPAPLPVFCENVIANSTLGYYSLRLKEHGILFHCTCEIPKQFAVSDSDLCVVLGNALENAMEACEKLKAVDARCVSVKARIVNGQLLIKITNTYNGTVNEADGQYLTTKEKPYHGIGLKNIKKVVDTYGGYVKTEHNETGFTLMVAFPEARADASLTSSFK